MRANKKDGGAQRSNCVDSLHGKGEIGEANLSFKKTKVIVVVEIGEANLSFNKTNVVVVVIADRE